MRVKVTTPVDDHNGAVGNVLITQGVGYADTETHAAELAYCRANGYTITEVGDPVDEVEGSDEGETAGEADESGVEDQMPRRNGSAEAWRAYAVAHGVDADEAEQLTRDQLVERFTSIEETES